MHSKINVSLIVQIYNNSEHLERLIEVLDNQTFRDCEFLLINDGSNDDR
ncbi:glycosyltransferase [Lactiplantibacillus pentosus]